MLLPRCRDKDDPELVLETKDAVLNPVFTSSPSMYTCEDKDENEQRVERWLVGGGAIENVQLDH